ncbi:nitrate:nitrite response transcriptional regulator [Oceanobacillus iheyensis HTE831]|uniref:Nitrate:nitrite response transcriptional regulator n=1 Tax=Oceanobacillus iheyensis (strain DSM 14371 / CIP 107618 / JCM 11309 / KCTC 3954 / HTE831) TaxID=221109 RepID=Q8EMF1_OCEIH|nr:LuxR C-terminal-related transcriptional regulator [Oceanobacillus iheyensis]BAC14853.1 nitrate:nitrite response transcriptional regulator [Oceanobacillus iheyensis HTE831]
MLKVVYVSIGNEEEQYIHKLLDSEAVEFLSWDRKIGIMNLNSRPHVFIFDLESLPKEDVLKKVNELKEERPDFKVIFFVPTIKQTEMYAMIECQVDSIFEKSQIDKKELKQAIDHLQKDYFYLPISIHKGLLERVKDLKQTNFDIFYQRLSENGIDISIREAYVAYHVKDGLRNLNIAIELGITEGTVKIHVSNLYRKLHIKGRKNMVEYLNNLISDSFIDKENNEYSVIL